MTITKARQCFAILDSLYVKDKGFVPTLVTENEPGHQPMIGRDQFSEPWYWGQDRETAQRICDEANARDFHLTPAEAKEIIDSSITAQIALDARRDRGRERMDQVFGQ